MSVSAGRGRHRPSVATRSHRGYAHRHRSLPALTLTEPPLTRVLQLPARRGIGLGQVESIYVQQQRGNERRARHGQRHRRWSGAGWY